MGDDQTGSNDKFKEASNVSLRRLSTVEGGPELTRITSGIAGLDQCLADSDSGAQGIPLGVSILLSGMPGGGKSSIATILCGSLPKGESLYLHGEEREYRVKSRYERLKLSANDPWLAPLRASEDALDCVREVKPSVCVVDSIQCLTLGGKRGHQNQFEAAEMLSGQITSGGGVAVMVCHVSKTGQDAAGAAALSHMVDIWLHVTMNAKKGERFLEVRKNRVGRAGFQVPVHLGISSVSVGTPAPLTGDGLAAARGPLEQSKEKAYELLCSMDPKTGTFRELNFYDFDVAGISPPGIWRIGLEMAVKSLQRDGATLEDYKVKGRRTFRVIALPDNVKPTPVLEPEPAAVAPSQPDPSKASLLELD